MKRIALLLLALGAGACDGGPTDSDGQVRSITLAPDPLGVGIGDTTRLHVVAIGIDNDTVDATPRFETTNPGIATVNAQGVVRGVSAGTTQVRASLGGRTATASVRVAAGSFRTFNVNSDVGCTDPHYRSAKQVATAPRIAIYEDIGNPAGGPTAAQYQQIANTIEELVYDVDVANFGAPTDIDRNGRVIVLYTAAVNELTPANVGFIVGGFQYSRDLFPREDDPPLSACPASNAGEMFYLLAADPSGTINNNPRSVDYVTSTTVGVVAHEFQHVINGSRRLHIVQTEDWEETVWLNEGLSHIAEELTFYAASGRAPRQNLDASDVLVAGAVNQAFANYGVSNIDRFDAYTSSVTQYGPFQDIDDLETRGATWALLRYAADQRGGNEQQLWFNLVNNAARGLPNLQNALGMDPMIVARNMAVANYTDDAAANVPSLYRHLSWNFRSVMTHQRWEGYDLQVIRLEPAVPVTTSIRAGSGAYFRFGVGPGDNADVRTSRGGTTNTGNCIPVTMTPGMVIHGTPENASKVCLQGGVNGAEYVLIPFNGRRDPSNESANSNVSVTVMGAGIRPPSALPDPVAIFPVSAPLAIPRRPYDGGFEARLRARERAELRGLVRGGRRQAVQMEPPVDGVSINIVRIR